MKLLLTCFLAALVAMASVNQSRAEGQYFEVSYPPSDQPGELQYGVTYTLWVPDGVAKLRGVIVHQHGCGVGACKGGETAAYDLHWQALAKKWDCALLGPSYHQGEGQECRLWCDPRNGSEKAFLKGLSDLAAKSKHPELQAVPWCLWGHSGGGFWASLLQTLHPERIVAIWFRSGSAILAWEKGGIAKPEIPQAAYAIPMVCNPGVKERDEERFKGAWDGSIAMFELYRPHGAPIAFAPDPRTAHECGDSRYLAIPFFDACLALRLPDANSADEQLKPVDSKQGWLAPLLGEVAAPAAEFAGEPSEANWLPNQRVARAWMEYVKTGAVGDATPPEPPISVHVETGADGKTMIAWDAVADLESGLAAFVIVRDGKRIGQTPEKPVGRFGRPLFQRMSYHDTPEQPLAEMRFVDASTKAGENHVYQVIAVNSVGLESKPAAAAK